MPPLDALVELYDPEDEMTFTDDVEIDDELANRLSALFRELLEMERQSIAGADDARRGELSGLITNREAVLNDDSKLDSLFGRYIATLSYRPSRVQERRIFNDWEDNLKVELDSWKNELSALENRPIDKQAIFGSARNKVVYLLRCAAGDKQLLPEEQNPTETLGIFDPFTTEQEPQSDVPRENRTSNGAAKRFYIGSKKNGISAECDVYNEKRIVVLAGSTAAKRENTGHPNYENQKQRLIAEGVLVDAGQHYKFAKDYELSSPSAAGGIILAIAVNGRQNLKDANGLPFARYYPK